MARRWGGVVSGFAFAALVVPGAGAQSSDLLRSVEDGRLAFSYALRAGAKVCRTGSSGLRVGVGNRVRMERWEEAGGDERCREDEAEVVLDLREGRVIEVTLLGPDETAAPDARILGRVAAPDAVRALLEATRSAPDVADDLMVAAVLADSVEVWRDLLVLARDRDHPDRVRRSALFWLGQEASSAVTPVLAETAEDDTEADGIREAAVFALAQRPDEESVPVLMDLARSAPSPDTRRSALFWLAQSDDPRVPDFFGELLRAPGRS